MGDGLGVGGDAVVHFTREVDIFRAEAGEGVLDEMEAFVRCAVLDEDLSLHCINRISA